VFAVVPASIVSFLSLYIYELPTHHCPFDMLQRQYGFIGYPIYLTLLAAVYFGLLPGLFQPLRRIPSLSGSIAAAEPRWLTWALGGYRETDDFGNGFGGDSLYNLTARVTGLPWYEEEGRNLVHLGLSYSHKFRNNDEVSFRQRPEGHLIDARPISATVVSDGVDLINPEAALVLGPWSLQAEYTHAFINASDMSDVDFSGLYIYGSYFITGENRPYKNGTFSRVKPNSNFTGEGGSGAWEVALPRDRQRADPHQRPDGQARVGFGGPGRIGKLWGGGRARARASSGGPRSGGGWRSGSGAPG